MASGAIAVASIDGHDDETKTAESFTLVGSSEASILPYQELQQNAWPDFSPSHLPSMHASEAASRQPSVVPASELSAMVQAFMEDAARSAERECDAAEDADALAFKSIESFNILCVGESGLGKSTFLRDIFAHLDPTKFHEARRRVAAQCDVVHALEDAIRRNEQESRQCDDTRALHLREERVALKARRDEARATLDELRQQKRQQEQTVAQLRTEIAELEHLLCELRRRRDAEEDDKEATRIGHEVIAQQRALEQRQRQLHLELRRSNLDRDAEGGGAEEGGGGGGGSGGGRRPSQTTEVSCRLIKEMPLFEGSRHGLDVTLIDTPGYGDVLVDSPANSSAAKVVAEVKRRIEAHAHKDRATRPGLPLDDEKKYWNELVHLCLFFVSPHRMKRTDVELMKRLHELVPLVVVIAKADTMTKSETREFKAEVRQQLQSEGVRPFAFDPRAIQLIERQHASHAASGFEPLYGGSDGLLPWAVMGSDESRREYLWGTAITNEPTHSELPALRDLLLRADGWSHLKRDAALKADAYVELQARELQARSEAVATQAPARMCVPRARWLTLSLRQLAFGLLALSAAVLQAHLVRQHALGQAAESSRRDTTLLHGLLERRAEGLQDQLAAVERERSELRRELRKLDEAHTSCKEALGKVNTEMEKPYTWWSRSKRVGLEHHVYE